MQVLENQCRICNKTFSSSKGLHSHISKSHPGWVISDYYHYYYPRYDLYTNELIKYKSQTQYFTDIFNSRENFSSWLMDNYSSEEALNICLSNLIERCKRRNNYSLPSQFILKSLMIPSIGGWQKILKTKDIKSAFEKYNVSISYNYDFEGASEIDDNFTIYQDSREQMPLLLDCKVEKMKLPVGDYTISEPYFSDVYIERKSLSDLVGTLTGGFERFVNEVQKAKTMDAYLVVVIEDLYSELYHYTSLNKFTKKVNGQYILKQIRDICNTFDNIQFVCAGSRRSAAELCIKILQLQDKVRTLDIEYLKDNRLI